jgi:hypothetical protein
MRAGSGETESAFPAEFKENARPPSRFSSEIGTKADAKQQLRGFCVLAWANTPVQNKVGPKGLPAAEDDGQQYVFWW